MIRRGILTTSLLISAISSGSAATEFGPGEASGSSQRSKATVDFKVLVWYRRDDALGTFKYQFYDVRKGEFTAAVQAWINHIPVKYSKYIVRVHDVDLKREKGETEMLKVGSVIKRDLMDAAAMSGIAVGSGLRTSPGALYLGPSQTPSMNRPLNLPSVDRSFLNPPPTPFPVPVPYPRPHP